MNNLNAYLSYIMWQFVIIMNYIMRTLTTLSTTVSNQYYSILYYYYPPDDIVFIENSMIKFGCTYDNFFNLTFSSFDYYVFNNNVDNKILKKIATSLEDLPICLDHNSNKALLLTPCNFQFIMVLFKTNNESFDMTNILNNKDNYYYVQNATIFDSNFIDWICLKHLRVKLTGVTVVVLDNSAEEITITPEQCIRLGTNGYTVELIKL